MASGTPFALNFVYLLFLLAPGYLCLRGYFDSTVQLDTVSRTDKILLAVIGGLIILAIMLILNRLGLFSYVTETWYGVWNGNTSTAQIGFNETNKITTNGISNISALGIVGFVIVESAIAYPIGYVYGTIHHVRSDQPQKSEKDLEQPWETAIRLSALGEEVTIITKEQVEIQGRLYRIGSPSQEYDLLLSAAKRIEKGADDKPLGITYHHYEDVSQVQFPEIEPEPIGKEGNWLVRRWNDLHQIRESLKSKYWEYYYRYLFTYMVISCQLYANDLREWLNNK